MAQAIIYGAHTPPTKKIFLYSDIEPQKQHTNLTIEFDMNQNSRDTRSATIFWSDSDPNGNSPTLRIEINPDGTFELGNLNGTQEEWITSKKVMSLKTAYHIKVSIKEDKLTLNINDNVEVFDFASHYIVFQQYTGIKTCLGGIGSHIGAFDGTINNFTIKTEVV